MCLYPITKKIVTHGVTRIVSFPCGQCLECVAKYQNEWSLRLGEEAKHWRYSLFFTFKYCNEKLVYHDVDITDKLLEVDDALKRLPINLGYMNPRYNDVAFSYLRDFGNTFRSVPVLDKEDIVLLMKRVRRNLQYYGHAEKDAFKYFVTGEYGPQTLRPHWHACVFTNVSPHIMISLFRNIWHKIAGRLGDYIHHFDGSIVRNAHSVGAYVSKYCCKPALFENPYVRFGFIPKPCHLISKGIGNHLRLQFADDMESLCKRYNIPYQNAFEVRRMFRLLRKLEKEDSFPSAEFNTFSKQLQTYQVLSKPISTDFFADLQMLLTRHIYNAGKILCYSIPRYYKDFVFPQEIYFSTIYNSKKQCYEEKITLRKSTISSIATGRARYFDRISVDHFNRSVEHYMQQYGYDYDKASLFVAADDARDICQRAQARFARFAKFYNKNYFKFNVNIE